MDPQTRERLRDLAEEMRLDPRMPPPVLRRARRRRVRTAILAGAVAAGLATAGIVGIQSVSGGLSAPPEVQPADPAPAERVCFRTEATGDFDGDGQLDAATLYADGDTCGRVAEERDPNFELTVRPGVGDSFSQAFDDCASRFECRLLGASDFNGDGEAELAVGIGPGATISFTRIYRIADSRVQAIELVPPGDPAGSLEPGPIQLGGNRDAVAQSGFECRVDGGGSRALVAWQAQRDRGQGPWRVHLTTLQLMGDAFVVAGTEDRERMTNLPATEGLCPSEGQDGGDETSAGLPETVEETRQAILEAARNRDWEGLRRLIPERGFTYSIGDSIGGGEEATAFWQELEATGETVLPTLVRLLEGPWAIDRPGEGVGGAVTYRGEVIYQWPAASAKPPRSWTAEDVRQLRQIATRQEIREYREMGYFGWVVGIEAEGTWLFYIAGD